jgi:hypothetical protein
MRRITALFTKIAASTRGVNIAAVALLMLLTACASSRLDAVPEQATTRARVTDIPNARYYFDSAGVAALNREAYAALARERAANSRRGANPLAKTSHFLALSGGGEDGAFGAGLLAGWTEHGTRPEFKLVTGVSAGALIAPFVFLGPEYDQTLRRIFSDTVQTGIYQHRSILAALVGDALLDSRPLFEMILTYLDGDVVSRIAQEYEEGRLLFVATTNLDAGRPVIWNIGAIAASRHPDARQMIAKILLASASVPAYFPPVFFDAEFDGRKYQEMHVDGGTIANAFLYPPTLSVQIVDRRRVAYLVRNGTLDVPWENVKRDTFSIAGRAVSALSASNTVNDIYQIYETTKRDRMEFNLAYIERDFQPKSKGQSGPEYVRALFDYGFQKGRQGYAWKKIPPGLLPDMRRARTSQVPSIAPGHPEMASASGLKQGAAVAAMAQAIESAK